MVDDRANWRMKTRRAAVLLTTAASLFARPRCFPASRAEHHAHAQSQHRLARPDHQSDRDAAGQPQHRRPGYDIAGRTMHRGQNNQRRRQGEQCRGRRNRPHHARAITNIPTMRATPRIGVTSTLPYVRYSPNLYPACSYAYRDSERRMPGSSRSRPMAAARAVAASPRKQEQEGRREPGRAADRAQSACGRRRTRGRNRRLADRRAGRRTGAASPPRAYRFAELSADRQHHRPVPHHRPSFGGDSEPRTRRRRQRSLGAAEFPLSAAGPEGGIDRGRSRAIRARQTSAAGGAYARPAAPTSPSP